MIIADEDDGQERLRVEALRSTREAEAVHLGGIADPAGKKHAIAYTRKRPLERLDEAIQGLLRRAPRHQR